MSRFDKISVRDERSKKFVCDHTNKKCVETVCDPTLLLTKSQWLEIIEPCEVSLPKYKYILFYDLSRNTRNWKVAKKISKIFGLPIIITSVPFPRVLHESLSLRIKKNLSVGPKEWLKLIYNAELVLSTSFHGTMFSIIFDKPFYTINTGKDNRVSYILKNMGLTDRIIDEGSLQTLRGIPDSLNEQELAKIDEMRNEGFKYIDEMLRQ